MVVKIFPLSDSIVLPLAPTIAGAITDYLQSIAQSLSVHSPRNCDNVDTELPQNLLWYWYFLRSIRQVPTLQYQYVSTIAHRLAAKSSFTPLKICQQLQRSTANVTLDPGDRLQLCCWCNDAGYIYFELTPLAIATWLEYIHDLPIDLTIESPTTQVADVDIAIYAHARCRSLLQLVHTENIIEITDNWQLNMREWSIGSCTKNQPSAALTSIFEHPAEQRLIQVLMAVLDGIYGHNRQLDAAAGDLNSISQPLGNSIERVKSPNWSKLTIDLAQSWLDFYRYCQIFGDVKNQNPHLAIARCGLTAISHRYLQVLLENYLGVRAVGEL